jgi:hypothetical protein
MFIIQLEHNNSNDIFKCIQQFFRGKCANYMINGFINIGNNQNLTYSKFLDYIAKFLLQLNNIQISKNPSGMLVEFNNYNLLLSEASSNSDIQLSIQIDYLPDVHVIISPHDIRFQFMGFGKNLSTIINKHSLDQSLQIAFQFIQFIINIRPHLNQLIPIITSTLNLISQHNSKININDNKYLVPIDHSVYTVSKIPSRHITHLYSISIHRPEDICEVSIFKSNDNQYILGIKYKHSIKNNWCCIYIY